MNENAALLVGMMGYMIIQKRRRTRNPTKWVKTWLLRKELNHMPLLRQLLEDDPDDFKNYLRMDETTFRQLLELVKDKLTKQDTVMRKAISPEERLIATLRFLASGRYYNCLRFSVGIAEQTLRKIIPETCRVLFEVLAEEYLKCPSTQEEWQEIATQFKNRWQFVNCGGALDGKHIRISRPPHSGAMFYNYKGFYSVVLMALVSADYKFTWLDVGKQGRISDGGILDWTYFYNDLKSNKLNFPAKEDNDFNLDFVLIGDEAFALDKHLLKPYAKRELMHEKQIFNYRLSRARNVVENAFGLLASRFRIFHTPIAVMNVEHINYIVAAACTLQNFLLSTSSTYSTKSTFDRTNNKTWIIDEGEWRRENFVELTPLQHANPRNASVDAKLNRDAYCDFFNGLGKVEWQESMLRKGTA